MTVARVEQINKPPPDALVLDRCGACGEVVSDEMILAKLQGRHYCDSCDGNKLPQPWSREEYSEDEEYEPAPVCYRCDSADWIVTFVRPEGQVAEYTVEEHMWCEDHAVFHLNYNDVIEDPAENEDDPRYERARCAGCGANAYVSYDWEA